MVEGSSSDMVTLSNASAPSDASVADAVWDEDLSTHTTSGSAGNVLQKAKTWAFRTFGKV